ncbi:39S ribosomal protein L45 [Cupriavidus cauae]|uniref:Tim44 domain-containing protein n=1 Tax=Cupriavidus cauae TaxID=2608999 RepID=A0A5M8AB40_9BURK|nr:MULTISPECIES: Tim44-like domain-containing protein [Cupriavidus]KAA0178561.1 Tim44 domain-containing protein [Cupriavidus gilardii]KAA6119275.1 Tim44 domain-containing protein [Cupriavidus cauae]MCA7085634.1 39S ribosomal protein L45 [Cupriavidus sp. DB3]UZN50145.1 39S ribosomal protein L45 [Cupriavidus cauae]
MSTIRGKFLAGSLAGMLAFGMVFDAEAKRMGGSRSFGKQSSNVTQQRQQAPQTPAQQQAQQPAQQAAPATAGAGAATAAAPRRNWGGILGGIAAGLGIGWLLSHFGLGGAALTFLSNLILIALIAMVAIWLIRKFRGGAKRPQPAYAGAGAAPGAGRTDLNRGAFDRGQEPMMREPVLQPSAQPAAQPALQPAGVAQSQGVQPWGVPADFDTEAFLRNAKVYFVRLQAAWDAGNLDDIREFTTPEMFAEIKMDLGDRGAQSNHTDVVTLDATLLGIESTDNQHVASVRFSGMIRENEGEAAQPFAEVWNLAKPASGAGGWVLAGIQQES